MSNKHKEIVTINIGGCGINFGKAILEQYAVEQGISATGNKEHKTQHDDSISTTFKEISNGTYLARSLFIDLDPHSINMIQNIYPFNKLINKNFLISANETGGNIWSRGYCSIGKKMMDKIDNKIRLLIEECDESQGFIINRSLAGGTGGGLGSLMLQDISVNYRKRCKLAFEGFYDQKKLNAPKQVYNAVLSVKWSLNHSDVSILLDNAKLKTICKNALGIHTPRYKHYNNLCCKLMSNVTAPMRFGLNSTLHTFERDLVLFPRLHFLIASLSPITPPIKDEIKMDDDIATLTETCLKGENFLIECPDFDSKRDVNLAMEINYRGNKFNECLIDIYDAMERMRINKKYSYIDWSVSDKPMIKLINSETIALKSDSMFVGNKQVTMIGNNTYVNRMFQKRIAKQYDIMYSQRTYVHWFVGEGMDEMEFAEARDELKLLELDYLDVLGKGDDESAMLDPRNKI